MTREDVIIGESSIEGLGVFAARRFEDGEGVLALDDSRVVGEERPLRPEEGEHERHCDYLAGGKVVLMPEPERYLNHSCDPNAHVKTIEGRRHVIALRRIEPGQEITLDYVLNTHGGDTWTCSCGSPACRGVLPSSFFELPVAEQLESLPLLDDWFVREHRERVEELRARAGDGGGG